MLTQKGESSADALYFTKRSDRNYMTRHLDQSIVNELVREYGKDFRNKLSFDKLNTLLLSLNYNPYPTKKIVNRPLRWMLQLDQSELKQSKLTCNPCTSKGFTDLMERERVDM